MRYAVMHQRSHSNELQCYCCLPQGLLLPERLVLDFLTFFLLVVHHGERRHERPVFATGYDPFASSTPLEEYDPQVPKPTKSIRKPPTNYVDGGGWGWATIGGGDIYGGRLRAASMAAVSGGEWLRAVADDIVETASVDSS
ncbi:hypothetical protein L1987_49377 [Smallanthus sonchifolius]|uniref:Uncharacterized protein n=1 Tax=Smallanthus sonchifolius TaxID=185202 RepID=A0ACB9FVI9_9ASTR|nr:hypothetical protein L1987_49377 [Smallanthus sonchifolius]